METNNGGENTVTTVIDALNSHAKAYLAASERLQVLADAEGFESGFVREELLEGRRRLERKSNEYAIMARRLEVRQKPDDIKGAEK